MGRGCNGARAEPLEARATACFVPMGWVRWGYSGPMIRVLAVMVVLSGCGGLRSPDAGGCESWGAPPPPLGCECGFSPVTRCGFTESANCGTCAAGLSGENNTCAPPPWDGGSAGSLTGPDGFSDASVSAQLNKPDAGLPTTVHARYFDRPSLACTSPAPPFSSVEVSVEFADGRGIGRGAYPLGDGGSVLRTTASGEVARGITGTVTLDRLGPDFSVGRFEVTLALEDGGTSPLQGSWTAGLCP